MAQPPERLDAAAHRLVRGPWLLVGVLAIALALVLALVARPGRTTEAPSLPPSPTPTPTAPTPTTTTSPTAPPGWQWQDTDALPRATGWRLVGLSAAGLVVIDPATQRIGELRRRELGGTQAWLASLVPTRGEVVVQAAGDRPTVRVTDDLELEVTPPTGTSVWFAGPDADWPLWRISGAAPGASGVLTAQAVDSSGDHHAVPLPTGADVYTIRSDLRGGLLVVGADGSTYRVTRTSTTRLTDRPVVAIGPSRLLTVRCDDGGQCAYEVLDATGRLLRRLPGVTDSRIFFGNVTAGSISPDGRTAIIGVAAPAGIELLMVDLDSGRQTPLATLSGFVTSIVWSPDATLAMGVVGGGNVLLVVDVATAQLHQRVLPLVTSLDVVALDPYPRPGWA